MLRKRRNPPAVPVVIPPLSSLPYDGAQALKAVNALSQFSQKKIKEQQEDNELLGGSPEDTVVSLVVTLKRQAAREQHKPVRIPLAHPLIDPRESPVCLFTKDPQREYKDLLAAKSVGFISRVVGVAKLRGKHSTYEARRALLTSHSLFLADRRILPLLPGLLGKTFFAAKKQPLGVDLTRPDLKAELERAVSGTSLRIPAGTCVNVKVADLRLCSPQQALENLERVLPEVMAKLPLGGWDNVQALHLKTGTSVSLPIWTAETGTLGRGRFTGETEAEKAGRAAAKAKREAEAEKKAAKKGKRKAVDAEGVAGTVEPEPEGGEKEPEAEAEAKPAKKKSKKSASAPPPAAVDAELSLVDGTPIAVSPAVGLKPTKKKKTEGLGEKEPKAKEGKAKEGKAKEGKAKEGKAKEKIKGKSGASEEKLGSGKVKLEDKAKEKVKASSSTSEKSPALGKAKLEGKAKEKAKKRSSTSEKSLGLGKVKLEGKAKKAKLPKAK